MRRHRTCSWPLRPVLDLDEVLAGRWNGHPGTGQFRGEPRCPCILAIITDLFDFDFHGALHSVNRRILSDAPGHPDHCLRIGDGFAAVEFPHGRLPQLILLLKAAWSRNHHRHQTQDNERVHAKAFNRALKEMCNWLGNLPPADGPHADFAPPCM